MKILVSIYIIFIPFIISYPQEEHKVLIEVFTNSHCSLCPDAHNYLDNYANINGNNDRLSFIYYHMEYPYPDDSLYHHNTVDSDGRDNYYNPFPATPHVFFDGEHQLGGIISWGPRLDQLLAEESPLKIILTGTKSEGVINIKVEITRTGDIADNDLVIHFVVTENVYYEGRNSIRNHKDTMRKMVTSANGEPFSIIHNETKEVVKKIILNPEWNPDSLKVVVFIQSAGSMNVYQSELITYAELKGTTNVNPPAAVPSKFILEQNYPNPFNPATKIIYHLPEENFITLKVYNMLGKEIKTLVNQTQSAGIYETIFNAADFSSGIYFYKLTAANISGRQSSFTKKMTILK